jgi:hypothetical protein
MLEPPNPALQPTRGGITVLAGERFCGRRGRLSCLFGVETRAGVACTVYPVRRIRELLFDASGRTGLSNSCVGLSRPASGAKQCSATEHEEQR